MKSRFKVKPNETGHLGLLYKIIDRTKPCSWDPKEFDWVCLFCDRKAAQAVCDLLNSYVKWEEIWPKEGRL